MVLIRNSLLARPLSPTSMVPMGCVLSSASDLVLRMEPWTIDSDPASLQQPAIVRADSRPTTCSAFASAMAGADLST